MTQFITSSSVICARSVLHHCIDSALSVFSNALLEAASSMKRTVFVNATFSDNSPWFEDSCRLPKQLSRRQLSINKQYFTVPCGKFVSFKPCRSVKHLYSRAYTHTHTHARTHARTHAHTSTNLTPGLGVTTRSCLFHTLHTNSQSMIVNTSTTTNIIPNNTFAPTYTQTGQVTSSVNTHLTHQLLVKQTNVKVVLSTFSWSANR